VDPIQPLAEARRPAVEGLPGVGPGRKGVHVVVDSCSHGVGHALAGVDDILAPDLVIRILGDHPIGPGINEGPGDPGPAES
jgi:hypothetical protein